MSKEIGKYDIMQQLELLDTFLANYVTEEARKHEVVLLGDSVKAFHNKDTQPLERIQIACRTLSERLLAVQHDAGPSVCIVTRKNSLSYTSAVFKHKISQKEYNNYTLYTPDICLRLCMALFDLEDNYSPQAIDNVRELMEQVRFYSELSWTAIANWIALYYGEPIPDSKTNKGVLLVDTKSAAGLVVVNRELSAKACEIIDSKLNLGG